VGRAGRWSARCGRGRWGRRWFSSRRVDFDEVAAVIGEVEEDAVGDAAGAGASDAAVDGEVAAFFVVVVGLAFEVIDDGGELAGGREVFVAAVEFEEIPVVEGAGADGEGEVAPAVGGDLDERLAVLGGEGDAGFDDGGEFGEEFGLHGFLSISG
jgi:hypothetical protein